MNSFLYPPGNNIVKDSKYKKTKDAMNAAVDNLIMRSAMGEYLGKPPLTSLGKEQNSNLSDPFARTIGL
jgi:hypothetical protein